MEGEVELLQLPEEVLRNILSFVPIRFEVASVCKKIYKIVCDIDKNKYKLNIGKLFDQVCNRKYVLYDLLMTLSTIKRFAKFFSLFTF